ALPVSSSRSAMPVEDEVSFVVELAAASSEVDAGAVDVLPCAVSSPESISPRKPGPQPQDTRRASCPMDRSREEETIMSEHAPPRGRFVSAIRGGDAVVGGRGGGAPRGTAPYTLAIARGRARGLRDRWPGPNDGAIAIPRGDSRGRSWVPSWVRAHPRRGATPCS